jgi:hypothetical protein
VSATIYSDADRRSQLRQLVAALEHLVPVAKNLGLVQLPSFEAALARAKVLSESQFSQAELSSLAREVPDVLPRHRDWASQFLQRQPDGSFSMPAWIESLEAVLQPALKAAETLRTVGYY